MVSCISLTSLTGNEWLVFSSTRHTIIYALQRLELYYIHFSSYVIISCKKFSLLHRKSKFMPFFFLRLFHRSLSSQSLTFKSLSTIVCLMFVYHSSADLSIFLLLLGSHFNILLDYLYSGICWTCPYLWRALFSTIFVLEPDIRILFHIFVGIFPCSLICPFGGFLPSIYWEVLATNHML